MQYWFSSEDAHWDHLGIGRMCSLAIKIFNSSPGDSKIQQSLRTTGLKGRVKTNKYRKNFKLITSKLVSKSWQTPSFQPMLLLEAWLGSVFYFDVIIFP